MLFAEAFKHIQTNLNVLAQLGSVYWRDLPLNLIAVYTTVNRTNYVKLQNTKVETSVDREY